MDEDQKSLVGHIVARIPQWIRHDLVSKDAVVRLRAEETLAAMIVNALESGTADSTEG